ncbi:dual adapter for phosphotyrosine and 3-phosphotyrosine and 3-phosphoinositide [Patella vulgata]|uniref:dual adapter for phosphotyrosine and 3-phosphotyrosine and 3-phosphoinositide n=1 Tax=Patella vulgata TaxID=6465 RepID=UPI00217F3D58|nr:dual adapter for phosphotyrosine and 3-phosphotyrosine and 3-phosphoinositide [Patella vulgata]
MEQLENLEWFHPAMNRHTAESLLMQNAQEGTYLLRPSSTDGECALSVRCENSVKHFHIVYTGTEYKFGHGKFEKLETLVEHFQNQPLIGGESGQLVLLNSPYPRDIEEPDNYESVTVHAEFSSGRNKLQQEFSINSKEGYLTKLGLIFKTWRYRWFVLQRNELKYYKCKTDKMPIRVLDLNECTECSKDNSFKDKCNLFRLKFTWRTFYFFAATEQDMDEWIRVITWRLQNQRKVSTNSQ